MWMNYLNLISLNLKLKSILVGVLVISFITTSQSVADTTRSVYLSKLRTALDASSKSFPNSQGFTNGYNYQLKNKDIINSQIKKIQTLCKLYSYSEKNKISLNKAANDGALALFKGEKTIIEAIKAQGATNTTIMDYEFVTVSSFLVGTFVYCNEYYSITKKVFIPKYQNALSTYLG